MKNVARLARWISNYTKTATASSGVNVNPPRVDVKAVHREVWMHTRWGRFQLLAVVPLPFPFQPIYESSSVASGPSGACTSVCVRERE